MKHLHRRLATLVAVGAISLLAPAAASATSTPEQIASSRTAGVGYLKEQQNKETGAIPGFGGDWALTSFAASGTAAADVNRGGKSTTDARTWYETEVGNPGWPGSSPKVTEFERAALLSYAAGIDPARIGKRQDLIAKIASYYQPSEPGYYGSVFNETVFGLIAMANTKTTAGLQRVPQPVLEESVKAVLANQHKDGGWNYLKVAGNPTAEAEASEPDMTGAAMAALCTSGVSPTSTAVVAGENYLASLFVPETGALNSPFGINTSSVAWAVDGLKACGFDPQAAPFTSSKYGKTPIDFLRSQQVTGGGFRYTTGTSPELNSSQDAVRALGSGGFTATPPKPVSGPQWKGATEFAAKETTTLALVVNDGVHQLKLCSVTITPKAAASTTLETVLKAATASGGTTPSGCLTQYAGTGAITQVNEYPAAPAERWYLQIDGGTEAKATLTSAVHVGDTLYLRFK